MTTVQKWGNSLAVRIPASLAEEIALTPGAAVEVTAEQGGLMIRPVKSSKYHLKEMLKDCRPEQLHGECDLGDAVGREIVE